MEPTKYPKINTIWNREPKELGNGERNPRVGCIIPGEYSEDYFAQSFQWHVTEKIHGMNTHIIFDMERGEISFAGRTAKHAFSKDAKKFLAGTFTHKRMYKAFPPEERELDIEGAPAFTTSYSSGVLFGELVGDKAQKGGGRYCEEGKDYGIVLYDAYINGTWLEWNNIVDIAEKLGLKTVPHIGYLETSQVLAMFESEDMTLVSILAGDGALAEGVVCTVEPMMLDRTRAVPIRWKIKKEDYDRLRRLNAGQEEQ